MTTKAKASPELIAAMRELHRRQAIVDQFKAERDNSRSASGFGADDVTGGTFEMVASVRPARPGIEREIAAAEQAVRQQTLLVDEERRANKARSEES